MRLYDNEIYRSDLRIALDSVKGFDLFVGKSILVLGASGLIGSFIVDMLLLANRERQMNVTITAMGRNKERLIDRFGEETGTIRFMICDVCAIQTEEVFDYVIDCAGYGHPEAFRTNPVEVMLSNVLGVKNICELAMRNPNCNVLFLSSGEALSSIDHLQIRACYPEGKKAAETLCLSYIDEYGLNVKIARSCHVFGPGVTAYDNRATAQFIEKAVRKENIEMYSKGEQKRSFLYVADCAAALLTVLSIGNCGEVYQIASNDSCSVYEFAKKCADISDVTVNINNPTEIEKKETSPIRDQLMEHENLDELGWSAHFSISDGIKSTIAICTSK